MDGVSRLQTRGWRKVGRVKGSKGIGFDVFNDDLIIIKGGRVLIFAATMLDHTVLRLGIRFSFFFFFFFKRLGTLDIFVDIFRRMERDGRLQALKCCWKFAMRRYERWMIGILEIDRLNFSKLCVSILGLPSQRLMIGYKY